MAKQIIQRGHETLRHVATPVDVADLPSEKISKLVKEMSTALASCEDGIALAAPQINESVRIFVVSGKLFAPDEKTIMPDLVFINPEIIKTSRKKNWVEEGCLSVRWLYGQTKRAEKVTVSAITPDGKKFTHHASGLLAQVFQHEIDHLNGILFTDHAKDIKEVKPEPHA